MSQKVEDLIKTRGYLLEFQKKQLIEDLDFEQASPGRIERIMDSILYRLFGKGWDALSTMEQQDVYDAWKGV